MESGKTQGPDEQNAKERLLRAAIALFAEKGYAGASVREIVELAGVTKPALYYYFRNKEGIFQAIMEEAANRQKQLLTDVLASTGTVIERLCYFYERIYEGVMENLDLFKMIHSLILGPPQDAPDFDYEQYHLRNVETVAEIYLSGLEKNEIVEADPYDIATLVLSVIDFCLHLDLLHPEQMDRERPKRLLRRAYHGLRRKPW